jgi:tungstate transport system substrate-binding protein
MKFSQLLLIGGLILLISNAQAELALRMATTTSTENSGLLTVLNPVFEKQHKVRIDVIAVGTGKALKLAENGDVDIVFVHAPAAEKVFVDAGYGVNRQAVMHNDFVILGPQNDPAQVRTAKTVNEVFRRISRQQVEFISRGDDSGTHKKEQILWQAAEIKPLGSWYVSIGQGMGQTLNIADEKQAYTLTDRGTYLAFQDKIDLTIVFENHPPLHNPYHIIAVNPKRYPFVHFDLAKQYINYLVSAQGQTIIAGFKKKGKQLFYPDVMTELVQ